MTKGALPVPLRVGVLGAARITANALLAPTARMNDVQVTAIAARNMERARSFAAAHQIPRVHPSYAALIADPEIDIIYNPLPNSLHAEWSIRALQAGKHVLCEKPLASNAEQARQMVAVAKANGLLLAEAFHNLYHPLAGRIKDLIQQGEIGQVKAIEAHFCTIIRRWNDIRYRYDLGGGATMDLGCYPIRLMRYLLDAAPQVRWARARCSSPQVDRWMEAEFAFPNGVTGRMTCAMYSWRLVHISLRVTGDSGMIHVLNPVLPHLYHRLHVAGRNGVRTERLDGDSTYAYQLRAFVAALREQTPLLSDGEDGVTNMQVIDAVYEAAGLQRRR
jgi:predicted dehydrogenase